MENNPAYSPYTMGKSALNVQQEMLEVSRKKARIVIGIIKEAHETEKRVPLTPEAVELLVNNGHEILIESGTGAGANYSDADYSERGAFILNNRKEVMKADVILKIAPLQLPEIEDLKGNQLIISLLHLNGGTKEYIRALIQKKVTAVAAENIQNEYNTFPVHHSMSAISGITAIFVAAELLSSMGNGKGVLLGGLAGITPTEVTILGASTAAEFAARAALGLGASVRIFDNSIHRLNLLQEKFGSQLYTSIFHPRVIEKALRSADVVIGTLRNTDSSGFYITEELVQVMKKGSVIVDLATDHGGCFETSECRTLKNPVFVKHDIVHYCIPNMPSRVARTASIALSNVSTPLILNLGAAGGHNRFIKENAGFRNGVYIFNGILTNATIGRKYDIPSQDISLLLAAF